MKTKKHKRPSFHYKEYNGSKVKVVQEEQLFDLPGPELDIAEYDIVDMWQVSVLRKFSKSPADLLQAHHTRPVRVHGLVSAHGEEWLLQFPVVSGYSVEDGDDGLDGNCKLFALGNCRWYRIRSASEMFKPMLDAMHAEARVYWALRDVRGTWMNNVDTIMETEHPDLTEGTADWTRTQEQVAQRLEQRDDQSLSSYWRVIHGSQNPKPSRRSAAAGEQIGRAASRYLLQHMITDQASFLWRSSRIFAELGAGNRKMRDELYAMYNIPIPREIVDSSAVVVPEKHAIGEPFKTEQDGSTDHPFGEASTLTHMQDVPAVQMSKKRKRSLSKEHGTPITDIQNGAEFESSRDKSRGWNEFEKVQRPILAQKHPTLSKKSLHKKLGRLYQESKTVYITSEDEENDEIQTSSPHEIDHLLRFKNEPADLVSVPWSNIKGTQIINRASDFRRRNPFSQIVGSNRKQSTLTLETLQSLLYEEDVDDLCMADMIYVWYRDFGEPPEKVAAIVISFAEDLLLGFSMTDRRHPSARQRGEPVLPENIWRATTLYDQIYKIHKIDGQNSDLLHFINWQAQDIFCTLELREGSWYAKNPELPHSVEFRDLQRRRSGAAHNSNVVMIGSDGDTEIAFDSSVAAQKGTSSLRPRSMMDISRFIRNGAGPKRETSPKIHKPKKTRSESIRHAEVEPTRDEHGSVTNIGAVVGESRWTTSEQFSQSIPDPVSQLRRHDNYNKGNIFSKLVIKRSPKTLGNNADIWRCRMPSCYFFQDNVHSIESQQAITEHYNAHADAALEGLDLLGEAEYGERTTALLHKLEAEAHLWTQAMNNDKLLLGN
ncbi:protein of unknown function [Taphrina deformans PYCC 5710]|uniref:Uncharacterized protein n=1 Tax=Taphrina deformans (strain PYCC 5710 / ATCC 11124 / CBS 356.35 / IMI 108563 / JCM 9778 / NBRC 8474) TaxID=1097556 RepID=R4X9J3_TAPDE|nr:protein of unknown function [Taphrina deformans PYCC 5710]|eukprot:CCG82075.1 protein of unknown function [Taphrina deformans PYCC 5710]